MKTTQITKARPFSAYATSVSYQSLAKKQAQGKRQILMEQSKPKNTNLLKRSTRYSSKWTPYHENEHLSHETINLKKSYNKVSDQNFQLKTKVAYLQLQNEKFRAEIEGRQCVLYPNEKESSLVMNLRKMVKAYKNQVEELTKEMIKIKRKTKYTQICEIELETKTMADQTIRLKSLIQGLIAEKVRYENNQERLKQAQRILKEKQNENENLINKIKVKDQYITELQNTTKDKVQNLQKKQEKMITDIANAKTRICQLMKKEQLNKREIESLKEKCKNIEVKKSNRKSLNKTKKTKEIAYLREKTSNLQIQIEKIIQQKQLQQIGVNKQNIRKMDKKTPSMMIWGKNDCILEQDQDQQVLSPTNVLRPRKSFEINQQLRDIGALMGYRLKGQGYSFSDFSGNILDENSQYLKSNQVFQLLIKAPFILSYNQAVLIVKYLFEIEQNTCDLHIINITFLNKLRVILPAFKQLTQQEIQQIKSKTADILRVRGTQLEAAFLANQNGTHTISKIKLRQILEKQAIDEECIHFIIGQMSLTSNDIEHLNFSLLFQEDQDKNELLSMHNRVICSERLVTEEVDKKSHQEYEESYRILVEGEESDTILNQ